MMAMACGLQSQGQPASGRTLLAQSTFDVPDELDGWWVAGDGTPPLWRAPGHIEAGDRAKGESWWWLAPSKFLQRRDTLFGAVLELDITQSETNPTRYQVNTDGLLVRFEGRGPKGGNRAIVCVQTPVPAPSWTRYTVRLDFNNEWHIDGRAGPPATEEDVRAVLATAENMMIRGEYSKRRDTGTLDNVRLWIQGDATPSPTLRIVRLGDGRLRLEWTATDEGWRLQSATELIEAGAPDAAEIWRPTEVEISRNGLLHFAIVTVDEGTRFFRLVSQ